MRIFGNKIQDTDLDNYVNKTEKNLSLADDDKVDAIKYYRKTYDFVLEKFGMKGSKKYGLSCQIN